MRVRVNMRVRVRVRVEIRVKAVVEIRGEVYRVKREAWRMRR